MRQSRRGFLDVLAGGRPDAGTRRALACGARPRGLPGQAAQGPDGTPGDRSCRRASRRSASAATRTRSAPARRRSTPSSSSSPRRAAIRSTARRPTATSSGRSPANYSAKPENVVLGAGSQEILKSAVRAFTSPARGLVTASPSFENPTDDREEARASRSRRSRSTPRCGSTSTACAAAAKGAGLVFLNNPNNPTATVHGAQGGHRFRRAGPRRRRRTR